jgi:hypothetical protein
MDLIQIRNQISDNSIEVYSCHPETFLKVKANTKDLPFNWIVYPNPYCKKDEFEQADLSIEEMKDFIFKVALPKFGFVRGEKR